MNFDEYWNDGFNSYDDARDAAKDAWQEQQAKIDELQARVDGALDWLNSSSSKSDSAVKHAIDCLKGNKDEN